MLPTPSEPSASALPRRGPGMTVAFGPLELWVLIEPASADWPRGRSAAAWVHDDGNVVEVAGWFVPGLA